ELFLAADVGVQGGGAGVELFGDAPHRQPVDALLVDDPESHLDDPVPIENLAPRLLRPPPPRRLGQIHFGHSTPKPLDNEHRTRLEQGSLTEQSSFMRTLYVEGRG